MTVCRNQKEFVNIMASRTRSVALDPYPPDLVDLDSIPERLDSFVYAACGEMEGLSNLSPHRLSPKGRPDVDLVIDGMASAWNNPDCFDPDSEAEQQLKALFDAIRAKLAGHAARAAAHKADAAELVTALAVDVFTIVEDGYELVARQFDEGGAYVAGGDGPDIAPGLVDAYRARMACPPRRGA